jgi:hypothetical protein
MVPAPTGTTSVTRFEGHFSWAWSFGPLSMATAVIAQTIVADKAARTPVIKVPPDRNGTPASMRYAHRGGGLLIDCYDEIIVQAAQRNRASAAWGGRDRSVPGQCGRVGVVCSRASCTKLR